MTPRSRIRRRACRRATARVLVPRTGARSRQRQTSVRCSRCCARPRSLRWTGLLGARPGVHDIERRAARGVAAPSGRGRELAAGGLARGHPLAALDRRTCLRCRNSRAAAGRRPGCATTRCLDRSWRANRVIGRQHCAALRSHRWPRGFAAAARDGRGRGRGTGGSSGRRAAAGRAPIESLIRTTGQERSLLAELAGQCPRRPKRCATWSGASSSRFRRNPLSPAAAVAYLGLLALDLRRVRGALATRALHDVPARAMILRPATASWFELLTSREELGAALDCLAATGSVQLQAYSRSESKLALPDLRVTLADFETLARRYAHYWPAAKWCRRTPSATCSKRRARRSTAARVGDGSRPADRRAREPRAVAARTRRCSRSCSGSPSAACRGSTAWPVPARCSRGACTWCPNGGPPLSLPPAVLLHRVPRANGEFLVAVGPQEDDRGAGPGARRAQGARASALPADLPADPAQVAGCLDRAHANRWRSARQSARAALDALGSGHDLPERSASWRWPRGSSRTCPNCRSPSTSRGSPGWCADADDARLQAALDARGLHYLLRIDARAGRLRSRRRCCATRAGRGRSKSSRD